MVGSLVGWAGHEFCVWTQSMGCVCFQEKMGRGDWVLGGRRVIYGFGVGFDKRGQPWNVIGGEDQAGRVRRCGHVIGREMRHRPAECEGGERVQILLLI